MDREADRRAEGGDTVDDLISRAAVLEQAAEMIERNGGRGNAG